MTTIGTRSPVEEEHELGPHFLIATEIYEGEPRIALDDADRLPTFATLRQAEICAAALRISGVFVAVSIVPAWADAVTDIVIHNKWPQGMEDVTDEDVAAALTEVYVVEATSPTDDAIEDTTIEVAGEIIEGIQIRLARGLQEAAGDE